VALELLPDQVTIGDIRISVTDQPHGNIHSAGLRFESDAGSIGYATDFNVMTDDMRTLYQGLDVWIVDALRRAPHPIHPTLAQALGWIAELAPHQAALTHLDQSMDYASLLAELPANVVPAHDGLEYRVGA
jgi:phosphoribosyl 1,2-cyclic phosphate phosphodiesterase